MPLSLRPHEGINDLSFGSSVADIIAHLGEPDSTEQIDNAADIPTTLLRYNSMGVSIFCEGEEPRMACVDIDSMDATLFGEALFTLDERAIVRLMVEHDYVEQDADNEAWGERRISFPQANIDFYLDDGALVSIIMGR